MYEYIRIRIYFFIKSYVFILSIFFFSLIEVIMEGVEVVFLFLGVRVCSGFVGKDWVLCFFFGLFLIFSLDYGYLGRSC